MRDTSLVSLAILKVNWDQGQDYIQNFVPFVAQAVQLSKQDEISIVELQQIVRNEFGLVVPQGALNTLLRRVERLGSIRRERGAFVRNNRPSDASFEKIRADVSRQHQALLDKFIEFCLKKHNVSLNAQEADSALQAHLQTACIPLLAAAVDGCAIPPPAETVPHAEFLISSFIVDLDKKDPLGFSFLETVVKGSMLATALFVPEISQVKRKFEKLTVYLDTPLLLRAMGLEGETQEVASRELLDLLYGLNVNFAYFERTKAELRGILEAAQHALREHRKINALFPVDEHFLKIKATPSDVEFEITNIDRTLKRLRIFERQSPAHVVETELSEMRLAYFMREEMPQQKEEPHRHDLDALSAIHRLRHGAPKHSIEACGHIFLTPNHSLAVASAKFSREQFDKNAVPLCVNDHTMATLAWVKNPTLVMNLSHSRLIADSYAALRPSSELWRKYLEETSRLQGRGDISDADADLLRLSTSAKAALVELTLGSPEIFNQSTVREVLDAAKAEARRETEIMLADEKNKRGTAEAVLQTYSQRIHKVSTLIGKITSRVVFIFGFLVAAVGCVISVPLGIPAGESVVVRWLVIVAILLFVALSLWSLASGGNLRGLSRKLEVWVTQKVENCVFRFLG